MTVILDSRGNPAKIPGRRTLRREEARPSTTAGVRSPYSDMVATAMTPARIISILKSSSQGNQDQWLDFAAEMERRDPHYFSLMQTRKLGVLDLKYTIEAPTDDAEDVELAERITDVLAYVDLHAIKFHALDALGKGYSVQEIIWGDRDGWLVPVAVKWRDPRFFKWEDNTADRLLRKSTEDPDGLPLKPYKYILHTPAITSGIPIVGGLARVCVGMHLFKSFAQRDWMAFAELYGMPLRIGKHPVNATPDEVETLRTCLRDLGSDAAAVIPSNLDIQFERSAMSGLPGGDDFFATMTRTFNEEMSKAILGQTMTSDDGSSQAQANVHNFIRLDLRNADARGLERTLNACLIRAIVDVNLGPRPLSRYPFGKFNTTEPQDLKLFMEALEIGVDRGVGVEKSVILDMFNLPVPAEGAEILESIEILKARANAENAPTTETP